MLIYKELGLSSEEVCELGKWKNLQAFSTHYLRLGAVKKAESLLTNSLVHKISPGNCEEHDLSSTPGKQFDQGGRDKECDAQSTGEPTPPNPFNLSQSLAPVDTDQSFERKKQ